MTIAAPADTRDRTGSTAPPRLASSSGDRTTKIWDATPVSEASNLQHQAISYFRFVAETVVLRDDLIQQIRQGDPRAWETLISRYEGRLLAFIQRRLRDRSATEDVVQETFVGFLNSLPNFDERRELQTYLFTIASHKLTDHLRRRGRHPLKTSSDSGEVLSQQLDHHAAASSLVRSDERRELESAAIRRCLGLMVSQWQEKGDYVRLKVLELVAAGRVMLQQIGARIRCGKRM